MKFVLFQTLKKFEKEIEALHEEADDLMRAEYLKELEHADDWLIGPIEEI